MDDDTASPAARHWEQRITKAKGHEVKTGGLQDVDGWLFFSVFSELGI